MLQLEMLQRDRNLQPFGRFSFYGFQIGENNYVSCNGVRRAASTYKNSRPTGRLFSVGKNCINMTVLQLFVS